MTSVDDVEVYLHVFEHVAERARLSKEQWADVVAPFLTGEPQKAYYDLCETDARDYSKLKSEILAHLGVNMHVRAGRVHHWTFSEGLPPRSQIHDLIHLVKKCLQPEEASPAQMVERVELDKYTRSPPPRIQRWVSQAGPTTADQLVCLVERHRATEELLQTNVPKNCMTLGRDFPVFWSLWKNQKVPYSNNHDVVTERLPKAKPEPFDLDCAVPAIATVPEEYNSPLTVLAAILKTDGLIERFNKTLEKGGQQRWRKPEQIYHVNLLKPWQDGEYLSAISTPKQVTAKAGGALGKHCPEVYIAETLSTVQAQETKELVRVNLKPYRIPEARRQAITKEVNDISFCDLSEPLDDDDDSYERDCTTQIPDLKLIRRIVNQVEFYLSDENLSHDAFLLKHVQKNKMGFVSIKLLTSFKKIKSLTRDWRQTLYALQFSELLEVNKEETKVRRKKPVPDSLLGLPPTKLLLVWDLNIVEKNVPAKPQNFLETVTCLFASYGIITSVHIIKPGKEMPCDVKKYLSKYPELATRSCALVEYESLEGARKALDAYNSKPCSITYSCKVIPVSGRGTRKKNGMESDETENSGWLKKKLTKKHRVLGKLRHTAEESSCYSSSESDSTPASPILEPCYLNAVNCTNADVDFKPQLFSSPRSPLVARKCFMQSYHNLSPLATNLGNHFFASPGTSPEVYRRFSENFNDSGIYSSSPWVQKRKAITNNIYIENKLLPCSPLAVKKTTVSLGLPGGVLRLPHGPDGSRGFHNSIGRGKLVLRH
ncbi:la-related protein 6-like [Leptodactylus fuscus]|uniref:la-related protein 6-like n=1 Tax=Leptodactylus fuscus TaxID=238119 RepID=UPI003F4EC4B9